MISREVEAAGGTLVRSKGEGDSTFSVFAHPAEAVAAAVAIQGAVRAESWPTAVPLRVRAAVHTGDAEPRDGDWYGPAVNRAARLRARADGGQTLLSGVTAGLVAEQLPEDVRLLYRGRRVLRGIERPEEVWELVAADDPRMAVPRLAKARGLPLARTGFVGRGVELGLLDELLGAARAGEPVTVLICGEAGAGKTRLVTEMAAMARDEGIRTIVGNCTVVGRTALAFAPFAEVLRTVVQELATADGSGAGRVGPGLARLVAGPGGGAATGDPRVPDPIGASAQLGLFEDVLDTLEYAAVPNGLLVVIEDLHWADPSSRGLFEFLSRNLRAPRSRWWGRCGPTSPTMPGSWRGWPRSSGRHGRSGSISSSSAGTSWQNCWPGCSGAAAVGRAGGPGVRAVGRQRLHGRGAGRRRGAGCSSCRPRCGAWWWLAWRG